MRPADPADGRPSKRQATIWLARKLGRELLADSPPEDPSLSTSRRRAADPRISVESHPRQLAESQPKQSAIHKQLPEGKLPAASHPKPPRQQQQQLSGKAQTKPPPKQAGHASLSIVPSAVGSSRHAEAAQQQLAAPDSAATHPAPTHAIPDEIHASPAILGSHAEHAPQGCDPSATPAAYHAIPSQRCVIPETPDFPLVGSSRLQQQEATPGLLAAAGTAADLQQQAHDRHAVPAQQVADSPIRACPAFVPPQQRDSAPNQHQQEPGEAGAFQGEKLPEAVSGMSHGAEQPGRQSAAESAAIKPESAQHAQHAQQAAASLPEAGAHAERKQQAGRGEPAAARQEGCSTAAGSVQLPVASPTKLGKRQAGPHALSSPTKQQAVCKPAIAALIASPPRGKPQSSHPPQNRHSNPQPSTKPGSHSAVTLPPISQQPPVVQLPAPLLRLCPSGQLQLPGSRVPADLQPPAAETPLSCPPAALSSDSTAKQKPVAEQQPAAAAAHRLRPDDAAKQLRAGAQGSTVDADLTTIVHAAAGQTSTIPEAAAQNAAASEAASLRCAAVPEISNTMASATMTMTVQTAKQARNTQQPGAESKAGHKQVQQLDAAAASSNEEEPLEAGDPGAVADKGSAEPPKGCRQASTDLGAYLPEPVVARFSTRTMYAWQAKCLTLPGVLEGHRNLLLCAPTSAGKSLIGEVAMLRRVLQTGRAALLVLPFRALCAQKATHLERLLKPLNKEVQRCYGQAMGGSTLKIDTAVMVCTLEKANLVVNRMLEEGTLGMLSCVVVDEVHMLGDEQRGSILESLCTKLLFHSVGAAASGPMAASAGEGIQMVGMSATIAADSAAKLASWLHAQLYTTTFRPVPLSMYLKVGRELRDAQGAVVRAIMCDGEWEGRDPDHIAWLANETVTSGHSVLVFCGTKKGCEAVAAQLGRQLDIPERYNVPRTTQADSQSQAAGRAAAEKPRGGISREEAVAELKRLPGVGRGVLSEAVARGVGFHHADLSREEQAIVEKAYCCGAICVLVATSTMAAGVNLPARRVICQPYVGLKENLLEGTKFRQMAGRAGRAGLDTHGEAILLASQGFPVSKLQLLLQEEVRGVASRLQAECGGMKRTMLEAVGTCAVVSPADVKRYASSTLLAATHDFPAVVKSATEALKWLGQNKLVAWLKEASSYEPTQFGKACLGSGLDPEIALHVYEDLKQAREGLVLASELHLTFLITPMGEDLSPDQQVFCRVMAQLPKISARVGELVGVNLGYISRLATRGRGRQNLADPGSKTPTAPTKPSETQTERIARRFYCALVLHDLIQEVSSEELQARYGVKAGPLHQLQERAGPFAAMVAAFCHRIGWTDLEELIAKLQARVFFGVRPDIVALTEIPHVKGRRARLLYDAGLRSYELIADSSVENVAAILLKGSTSATSARDERLLKAASSKIVSAARGMVKARERELRAGATALCEKLAAQKRQQQHLQQQRKEQQRDPNEARTTQHGSSPAMSQPSPMVADTDMEPTPEREARLAPTQPVSPSSKQVRTPAASAAALSKGPTRPPVPSTTTSAAPHQQPGMHTHDRPEQRQPDAAAPQLPCRAAAKPPAPTAVSRPHAGFTGTTSGPAAALTSAKMQQHNQHAASASAGLPSRMSHGLSAQESAEAAPLRSAHAEQQLHQQLPPTSSGQSDQQQQQQLIATGQQHGQMQMPIEQQQQQQHGQSKCAQGAEAEQKDPEAAAVAGSGWRLKGSKATALQPTMAGPSCDKPVEAMQQLRLQGLVEIGPDNIRDFLQLWRQQPRWAFAASIRPPGNAFDASLQLPALHGSYSLGPEDLEAREVNAEATVEGLAVTWIDGFTAYLRMSPHTWTAVAQMLSSAAEKVTYNLKPQIAALASTHNPGTANPTADPIANSTANPTVNPTAAKSKGLRVEGPCRDVRIMAWLINPDRAGVGDDDSKHLPKDAPKHTAEGLLQAVAPPTLVAHAKTLARTQASSALRGRRAQACEAACIAQLLHGFLQPLLQQEGLLRPLCDVEMPLVPVLADMEAAGFAFDPAILKQVKAPLKRRLAELEGMAHAANGALFNLDSSREVSEALFDRMRLPVPPESKETKSKSGYWSTGKEVLEKLRDQHVLPAIIIEHRQIAKRLEGFVEFEQQPQRRLPRDAAGVKRISGCICHTEASTGRLAMTNVNLQNVPKPADFQVPATQTAPSQLPELLHRMHTANIRAAFVAPPGYVLVSADYCQLELRIMAHFSGDEGLLAVLSDARQDPFRTLAHRWLRVPLPQVSVQQRNQAKRLAYALLYGMGAGKLAGELGVEPRRAGELCSSFKASLPGVDAWLSAIVEHCRQSGFVQTLGGRRRYLPAIVSANNNAAAAAERKAVNTVCQGSAADLAKQAMIRLHSVFQQWHQQHPQLPQGTGRRPHLLVQIHDELLFEVPQEQLAVAATSIRQHMEGAAQLQVPLRVKLHVGASWGSLQELLES